MTAWNIACHCTKLSEEANFLTFTRNSKLESFSQARCQMDLRKFPLDSQTCPLEISSFGHSAENVIYRWSPRPLSMEKLGLAQYHMVNWSFGEYIGPTLRFVSEKRGIFNFHDNEPWAYFWSRSLMDELVVGDRDKTGRWFDFDTCCIQKYCSVDVSKSKPMGSCSLRM